MLTRDEVLAGFRLILGREPESEQVVEYHRNHPNAVEFGRVLRESEEFQMQAARARAAGGERQQWIRRELPSGLSLWVNLHDDGVSAGILRGAWEPAETNFILSVIRPGDAVIDVGANLGWYTLTLAQALGPEGHVFAFEPRSDIFAQLERSVQDNGFTHRCTLSNMALGAHEGQRNLAWSPAEMNQGHSFIVTDDAQLSSALAFENVQVATLDGIGIDRRVRLIKLDVEGAELGVLLGGRDLIARDLPIILSEVFPKWLRRLGTSDVYSLLHALDDLDYRAHYLTDNGIGGEVHWPLTDLESDYVYYSVVFLSARDRTKLLDGRKDDRLRQLEVHARSLATDVEHLTRELATAETRAEAGDRARHEADLADERAAALAADVDRLTSELAAAETAKHADVDRLTSELAAAQTAKHAANHRAQAAEFRNLELAGQALRVAAPAPDSEGRILALQTQLAAAQTQLAALQTQLAAAQTKCAEGDARAEGLRVAIDALYRSTSWRVTAPLRVARRAPGWLMTKFSPREPQRN